VGPCDGVRAATRNYDVEMSLRGRTSTPDNSRQASRSIDRYRCIETADNISTCSITTAPLRAGGVVLGKMRDFAVEFLESVKFHGKFTESMRVDLLYIVWWDVSK